jgi:hypothetical protein
MKEYHACVYVYVPVHNLYSNTSTVIKPEECGDSEIVCALVLYDGEINLIANSNVNVKGHNVRFIYKARK